MIKPTIGRVVWYWPPFKVDQPNAAFICYVHEDDLVNLSIFDEDGHNFPRTMVTLFQGKGQRPSGGFCEWMPYQLESAKGIEALEKKLAELRADHENFFGKIG